MALTKRNVTVALVTGLALALVALPGCTTTKVVTAPAGVAADTVTASGTGAAQAAPDTAEVSLGVTTTSSDAKAALDDASRAAERIAAAVKKLGVAGKDIQTRDLSVYPQTTERDGKQVITGYQASLSVQVKVRDMAKLGKVISAANAAGANTIDGPWFTVDDPAPFRAEAMEAAVKDARSSAEAMAKAAGRSIGAVLSMSSSDVGVSPRPLARMDMAEAAQGVPIEPGELDITASVVVVFELE